MALNKKPYKGCRDFFPSNMRVRDFLFNQMKRTAESFAYEAYDGPLLEEVELYKAKSGEELINDQIYSFTDRGDRFVAVRPEMTPTLARMVANVHKESSKPLRWYSIPNLMRYEKPQRGRVREHWQFNVDIFGAPQNLGEIEIITLVVSFLKSFGADSSMFNLLVNDRHIVDSVFNHLLKLSNEQSYKLYKVIDKSKKVTKEKLDEMIGEVLSDQNQISIFKNYLELDSFKSALTFLEINNLKEQCAPFIEFIEILTKTNLEEFVKYDPLIVRGLDYYTGIVFEVFDKHPDNNRAIAGGGAYANLLQIFNEAPLPGIGFGLGDVTLKDFLETHKLLPDLALASNDLLVVNIDDEQNIDNYLLSNELRGLDLKVESYLGKLKFNKIVKIAENKGFHLVAIIEVRDDVKTVQIRNLKTKDSRNFQPTEYLEMKKHIKESL